MKDFNIYLSTLKRKSEREVKCLALILQLAAVLKETKQNTKPTPLVGSGEGVKQRGLCQKLLQGRREETIIKQTKIESQFHVTMFFFFTLAKMDWNFSKQLN